MHICIFQYLQLQYIIQICRTFTEECLLNTKIMGSTTVGAAIINIVINAIFIPKFGIYAASFSTLISNLVVYVYRRYKLQDYIKLKSKPNIIYYLLLIITLVTYYYRNTVMSAITFVIVLIYCIYTNKNFIKEIINPIVRRIKSKNNES